MHGTLVYDGDCGFCTKSAKLIAGQAKGRIAIVPWQRADLDALGLTAETCQKAVQWVDDRGVASGDVAIARSLIARGGVAKPLGWALRTPPIRWIAPFGYRTLAANRGKLPGATDACRIDGT
jgi:predicted DCC family thiol-disulfide oxidoreductase YuxK